MKLIYKSSYDRGLEHLLNMWPQIKTEVPEATLSIFYGWNLFDKGHANNHQMMRWKENMIRLMSQDGITEYGRVSKQQLDEATANSDIWAYPTHFGETNCITALDSQKLGCVPVTIAYAGLLDTVYSGVLIEGDIYEKETREQFVKELISLWKDKKKLAEEKQKGINGAKEFAWSNIALKWVEYFK
jgi:glycosyltransferase involved in cell wall biosynthesis